MPKLCRRRIHPPPAIKTIIAAGAPLRRLQTPESLFLPLLFVKISLHSTIVSFFKVLLTHVRNREKKKKSQCWISKQSVPFDAFPLLDGNLQLNKRIKKLNILNFCWCGAKNEATPSEYQPCGGSELLAGITEGISASSCILHQKKKN